MGDEGLGEGAGGAGGGVRRVGRRGGGACVRGQQQARRQGAQYHVCQASKHIPCCCQLCLVVHVVNVAHRPACGKALAMDVLSETHAMADAPLRLHCSGSTGCAKAWRAAQKQLAAADARYPVGARFAATTFMLHMDYHVLPVVKIFDPAESLHLGPPGPLSLPTPAVCASQLAAHAPVAGPARREPNFYYSLAQVTLDEFHTSNGFRRLRRDHARQHRAGTATPAPLRARARVRARGGAPAATADGQGAVQGGARRGAPRAVPSDGALVSTVLYWP
jgi:hypothetical protein